MIVLIGPATPPAHGVSLSVAQFIAWCDRRQIPTRLIASNVPWDHGTRTTARLSHLLRLIALIAHSIRLSIGRARCDAICLICATKDIALYRDIIIALVLNVFRRRFAVHVRGTELGSHTGLRRSLIVSAYGKADKIYASPQMAELHRFMNLSAGKVSIIPNGIEDYLDGNIEDKIDNFKKEEVRLVFLSNLYRFKGVEAFLEVVRSLNERGINIKAEIAGAFTTQFSCNRMKQLIEEYEIGNIVRCIGAVDQAEKRSLLARNDILVFPSERESFGNVVVEAMSAGVLVIANGTTSMDFILRGDAGYALHPFEATLAAELIDRVDARSFAVRVRRARQSYLERFTIDKYASDVVNALRGQQCAQ